MINILYRFKSLPILAALFSSFSANARCTLDCATNPGLVPNGICNQISLFSIPVNQIAKNIDFDSYILANRRKYEKTSYLPYIAGDDEKCYQRRNKQYGIWVEGFGAHVSQDNRDLASGYNGYGQGLVIGLERNFDHKLRLGFAYAYSQEHLHDQDLSTNAFDMKSNQALVYGRYQTCDIYYSAVASFALNRYAQGNDLLLDNSSYFTGWQFNGKLEAGYDFCRRYCSLRYHIVPHVMATYGHVRTHAYQMPNGLNVQNEPLDDAQLGLGVLLSYDNYFNKNWCPSFSSPYFNYQGGNWRYTPYIRLLALQGIMNEEQRMLTSFPGLSESGCSLYSITGPEYTKIIGLGIAFDFKDNNYLSFEYDWESKGSFTMHAAFIKYKIEWC